MFTVEAIPPSKSILEKPTSASAHVLERRLVEIQPNAQTKYSESTNSQIEFDLTSRTDFVDFMSSYFRMDITCSLTNDGVNTPRKYLAEGGAHSLFRSIDVSTLSGTEICRIDDYNRLHAILSSASHSPHHVDLVESKAGDSVAIETVLTDASSSELQLKTGTVLYDVTGGASEGEVSGSGTLFLQEFQVGDFIYIKPSAAGPGAFGYVATITDNTTMTLEGEVGTGVDVPAGSEIYRLRPGRSLAAIRKLAANTSKYRVCFQPSVPFFSMVDFLPLFLFYDGIRIRFTLARPEYVLAAPEEPVGDGFGGANVIVENPVMMANFVQPDPTLKQMYMDAFNSPEGISYHYLDYEHFLDIIQSGQTGQYVSNLYMNRRSARHVLGRIQNVRANTITAGNVNSGKSTYTCDSIAQGLKANLSEVLFTSGSSRFPTARPIQCSDISNSELYAELLRTMNHSGSVIHSKRFHPAQWTERSHFINEYEATQAVDSQRLIIAVDLTRDLSPWSGLDLSIKSLQSELSFDAVYQLTDKDGTSNPVNAAKYLHYFVGYDAAITISNSSGINVYH